MSDQPERPIEKLLREYGRQRRPSEPFKLHAATRRLLQGEVSRVYRDKRLKPRWLCLSTFPKLAWGLCGVAILGLISIQLMLTVRQNKSENLLAQKEERAAPALPGAAPIATRNKELLR